MWLVSLLLSCSSDAPVTPSAPAVDPHAGHADHAEHAAAGGHADHHAAGGGHMAEMAKTRESLRAALGPAYDAPVAGLDGADAAAGGAVYDQHCASCHGPAGKGDGPAGAALDPPAADFTDAFHSRYYSDAGRVHIIRNGSPGTAMTGFGSVLTEQQVLDVYTYVRSLRGGAGPAAEDHSQHQQTATP